MFYSVVFRILVVVVVTHQLIDTIANNPDQVYLPFLQQFDCLPAAACGGKGKPNDHDGGIDFWREAGGVIGNQDRRAIEYDVFKLRIKVFQQLVGFFAEITFAGMFEICTARYQGEVFDI